MKASATIPAPAVLVVVHPGSCCGSADFHYNSTSVANAEREGLIREWNAWDGGVLIIETELSDELPRYPALNQALKDLAARARRKGFVSERRMGDDPGQTEIMRDFLDTLNFPPETVFIVTGAWYYSERKGCVPSVRNVIRSRGYKVSISETALTGRWRPGR